MLSAALRAAGGSASLPGRSPYEPLYLYLYIIYTFDVFIYIYIMSTYMCIIYRIMHNFILVMYENTYIYIHM